MSNDFQGHLLATHVTTADAVIKATPGYFYGLNFAVVGAVTPTITVYDDPDSATAPIVYKVTLASAERRAFVLPEGVYCATGIYIGASAWTTLEVTVYWK